MRRALMIAVCVLFPAKVLAHSWLDHAPDLTEERVVAVVEAVEALDLNAFANKPSRLDSFDFLQEVANALKDRSGDSKRVLFIFEAIRVNHVDQNGEPVFGLPVDWEDRFALRDFLHVSPYVNRLQNWLQPHLED